MSDKILPRYPIYVPSKARHGINMTIQILINDGVDPYIVVEPQDVKDYGERFGHERLLVLPKNDQGLIFARNWIFEHSIANGDERHWQIDDNINTFYRRYKGQRVYSAPSPLISAAEDFTDRYANVALSGMNYDMFVPDRDKRPPFTVNAHVYSCTLINNSIPYRFRPPANEDVDMCLQVLSGGWCTVLFNAFLIDKARTMTVKGGQTDTAYQGDGRLFMARALQRKWPGVVTTDRRFKRPQHVIKNAWKKFDTPLIKKEDFDPEKLKEVNEYNMNIIQVTDEIKHPEMQAIFKQHRENYGGKDGE